MQHIHNDGGRSAAGFRGHTGDCVARSIAIAGQLPYREVYEALARGNARQRKSKGAHYSAGKRTARQGIQTQRKWFKDYMACIGFVWTPLMGIGTGCKLCLGAPGLPPGRLVVCLSRHYTAVVDGDIHDTYDPRRFRYDGLTDVEKAEGVGASRCVYGYWMATN